MRHRSKLCNLRPRQHCACRHAAVERRRRKQQNGFGTGGGGGGGLVCTWWGRARCVAHAQSEPEVCPVEGRGLTSIAAHSCARTVSSSFSSSSSSPCSPSPPFSSIAFLSSSFFSRFFVSFLELQSFLEAAADPEDRSSTPRGPGTLRLNSNLRARSIFAVFSRASHTAPVVPACESLLYSANAPSCLPSLLSPGQHKPTRSLQVGVLSSYLSRSLPVLAPSRACICDCRNAARSLP